MKKALIILLTFVALFFMASYVFIPSKIKISAFAEGHTSPNAALRYLLNDVNWTKWWPDSKPYHLTKKMFNVFELQLLDKNDTLKSVLQLHPASIDSTWYTWTCEIESSKNPFVRWAQYIKATRIKRNLDFLIDSLKNNLEKEENVYGFKIERVFVTDSVLISTRNSFYHYPGEKEIDIMIQQLKKYISSQHAIEKNYPMLNVHHKRANEYEAMVAIATERLLPATNNFTPKLVLKGGNLLQAEIKGGPSTIKKAFDEFENYRSDFGIASPAIPYQLMITDRIKQPDTTKWLTKFYYPVY